MSAYFLDSSALVKRYIAETGSAWIQGITARRTHNKLIIARITWVEAISALARRQRDGILPPTGVAQAIRAFRYYIDTQYQVVELDRALAESAGQLVGKYPLRAYEAIQLASAMKVYPAFTRATTTSFTFLSADNRLIPIAHGCSPIIRMTIPNRCE